MTFSFSNYENFLILRILRPDDWNQRLLICDKGTVEKHVVLSPVTLSYRALDSGRSRKKIYTHDECARESRIKRNDTLQIRDLFRREVDVEGFDVSEEVLDFTTTNNRKYVRSLEEQVGDSNYAVLARVDRRTCEPLTSSDALSTDFGSDFL